MSVEMEAADVLVDSGERVKALNEALSSLQGLALHRLSPPWDIFNPACLHHQAVHAEEFAAHELHPDTHATMASVTVLLNFS